MDVAILLLIGFLVFLLHPFPGKASKIRLQTFGDQAGAEENG